MSHRVLVRLAILLILRFISFWVVSSEAPVYLDYNATTPVDETVCAAISLSLKESWGNPSSSHDAGRKARADMDDARRRVGLMINAESDEIVFTSGGTEANNMVFHTVVSCSNSDGSRPHVILSSFEHPSVTEPILYYIRSGKIDATYIPANDDGFLDVSALRAALRPTTRLVSVMLANNETGNIQPIGEISRIVKAYNHTILVHTDAAQAVGKLAVDVKELGVDYLTIVGHKFYGPRIGALFARGLHGVGAVPLVALIRGGGQERSFRAGTENVAMIVGLGQACELVHNNLLSYVERMAKTRDILETTLTSNTEVPVWVNSCSSGKRLPNTLNFCFIGEGLSGHRVLSHCRSEVFASTQAACHSKDADVTVSKVLLNSGVALAHARNAIRLSTGRDTTDDEAKRAAEALLRSTCACLADPL